MADGRKSEHVSRETQAWDVQGNGVIERDADGRVGG